MQMKNRDSWTLFEFIGGPRDSELLAGPNARPDDVPTGYRLRTNPLHASTMVAWQQAASRAENHFGQGTPDRYARLVWDGRSFAVHPDIASNTDRLPAQRRRMEHALIDGEDHEARMIAAAFCVVTPSQTQLIELVLAPALRSIGNQWAAGKLSIYVEQRASAIVHGILGDHSASSPDVAGQRASVATITGNKHALPARMAAVALREDGWQVDELAGPIPPQELVDSAIERKLDLVVVSTTLEPELEAARDIERQLDAESIPVLIGQPGKSLTELQRRARRISLATHT